MDLCASCTHCMNKIFTAEEIEEEEYRGQPIEVDICLIAFENVTLFDVQKCSHYKTKLMKDMIP